MKKVNLEEYIKKNKEHWNDKSAPEHIWSNIENELDHPRDYGHGRWKKIILTILIIIGLLVIYNLLTSKGDSFTTQSKNSKLEFAELENFHETEQYYQSAINVYYEKIQKYNVDATLEEDLRLLDENYTELLEEYKNAQGLYKGQVLRAIILNQKTKLQILENVLFDHEQNETQQENTVL